MLWWVGYKGRKYLSSSNPLWCQCWHWIKYKRLTGSFIICVLYVIKPSCFFCLFVLSRILSPMIQRPYMSRCVPHLQREYWIDWTQWLIDWKDHVLYAIFAAISVSTTPALPCLLACGHNPFWLDFPTLIQVEGLGGGVVCSGASRPVPSVPSGWGSIWQRLAKICVECWLA